MHLLRKCLKKHQHLDLRFLKINPLFWREYLPCKEELKWAQEPGQAWWYEPFYTQPSFLILILSFLLHTFVLSIRFFESRSNLSACSLLGHFIPSPHSHPLQSCLTSSQQSQILPLSSFHPPFHWFVGPLTMLFYQASYGHALAKMAGKLNHDC